MRADALVDLICGETRCRRVHTYPGSPARYLYRSVDERDDVELQKVVREQHIPPMMQMRYYRILEEGRRELPVAILGGELGEAMALQSILAGSITAPGILVVAEEEFESVGHGVNLPHQSSRSETGPAIDDEKLRRHEHVGGRLRVEPSTEAETIREFVARMREQCSIGILHVPLYVLDEYDRQIPASFYDEISGPVDQFGCDDVRELVDASSRPMLFVGRGMRAPNEREAVERLAESLGAPVATTLQMDGRMERPTVGRLGTGGTPRANEAFFESDLVLALGASVNAVVTSYRPENIRAFQSKVLQLEPNPERQSRFVRGAIASTTGDLLEELDRVDQREPWFDLEERRREGRLEKIPDMVRRFGELWHERRDGPVLFGIGLHMLWGLYSLGSDVPKEVSRSGSMGEVAAGLELGDGAGLLIGDGEFEMDLSLLTEARAQKAHLDVFVVNNESLALVAEKERALFDKSFNPKREGGIDYEGLEEAFPHVASRSVADSDRLEEAFEQCRDDRLDVVEMVVDEPFDPELYTTWELPRLD